MRLFCHLPTRAASMDTEQELPLQAVVLADAFEYQARYGPLVRGGGKDGEGCDNAQPWVGCKQ